MGTFTAPGGLGVALDATAGQLYIADTGHSTIQRLDLSTQVLTTIAGSSGLAGHVDAVGVSARFVQPSGLALDGRGHLYVTDPGDSTVRRMDLATGAVVTWVGQPGAAGVQPGPLPARLNKPYGIAVAPTGQVLVADQAENAILIIE